PRFSARAKPVGPTDSRAQVLNAQALHPGSRHLQPRIFKMKPLADSHALGKMAGSRLGSSVLAQESHIVMTVVRAALGLFVACGGGPRGRQGQQAVPMDPLYAGGERLSGLLQAEDLPFLPTKRPSG